MSLGTAVKGVLHVWFHFPGSLIPKVHSTRSSPLHILVVLGMTESRWEMYRTGICATNNPMADGLVGCVGELGSLPKHGIALTLLHTASTKEPQRVT
jgi:hypothetical protein